MLTGVFDVVDVLPLAERVAVLAPARARPRADVHQDPVYVNDTVYAEYKLNSYFIS